MAIFGVLERFKYRAVSIATIAFCLLGLAFGASAATAATNFTVSTTADSGASSGACGSSSVKTAPSPLSLREAVCLANNIGGEVNVTIPSGTYKISNGELKPGQAGNLTVNFTGAGAALTVLDAQGLSRIFDFDEKSTGGVTSKVKGVTITGGADSTFGGAGIIAGSAGAGPADELTLEEDTFRGNVANQNAQEATNKGGGAVQMAGGKLTVLNSTFSENRSYSSAGSAIATVGNGGSPGAQGLKVVGSTFTANKSGGLRQESTPPTGGAVYIGNGSGENEITESSFIGNEVNSNSHGAYGAAIYEDVKNPLTVTRSTFTENKVFAEGGGPATASAIELRQPVGQTLTIRYNRFHNNNTANAVGGYAEGGGNFSAIDNWWGCNAGPGNAGCDGVGAENGGSVTTTPRLQFRASASPTTVVGPNGTSTLNSNFATDSAGTTISAANLAAFNGASVTWSDPQPSPTTINGTTGSSTTNLSGGQATATYNSASATGSGHAVAAFDNASSTIPLTVDQKPAITGNPSSQMVTPGSNVTFTASATGTPTPTVQWERNTGSGFAPISGATSTTYSFTAAKGETGYQFRAVFTNTIEGTPYTATTTAATLTVGKAQTTLSTNATSTAIGGEIHDTATLAGGSSPGGTITFKAYAPSDTTCSATTPAFTSSPVTVTKNGSYESGSFTPNGSGEYRWTAVYSGDANNEEAVGACNAANEKSTVSQATTTLSTNATSATIGGPIHDTATLSGGSSPTGTITFKAYAPSDTTCSAPTPAFTSSPISVTKNGSYESGEFTPVTAGEYRWTASYSGDANNKAATGACNAANELSTITKLTPTLATAASSSVVGNPIHDTATIAGGYSPGGTITFKAYAPGDTSCVTAVETKSVTVSGNGEYTSPDYTPKAAGSYRWTATYSGDANNAEVVGACNAANEASAVTEASPTISTNASNGLLGGQIHDTATLASGYNPGGTITFKVYATTDTTCVSALETWSVSVTKNGTYESPGFNPGAIGEYRWTAVYSGDANNKSATGACNAPNEKSTVGKAATSISTNASSGTVGGTIHDTATLSGGVSPSGTITFSVYGPTDTNCVGPVETWNQRVGANGNFESPNFTPAAAGEYRWTASYTGDANNEPAVGVCNAANEKSTVAQAVPTLSTNATSATIGGAIHDTATIAAGFNPGGTITFKAYAPSDTSCSAATPAFTSSPISVTANGSYESGEFTPATAGEYRWTATYTGDANNKAATGACNAANEVSAVAKVTPTLSTQATSSTTDGSTIGDTATLAGGYNPGGTIVIRLFGLGDTNCSKTALSTTTDTVTQNGTYQSADYGPPLQAGDYRWTAVYSGDANNAAVTEPCNAPNETSNVGQASPTISTTASGAVVGNPIHDTATIAGGVNPGGTITFEAFAPGDTTCSSPIPAATSTVNVTKNGNYESASYTPGSTGEYLWTAVYSGDANNKGAASSCGDPSETSKVGLASPTISTEATSATIGGTIHDTATIAGGQSAGGTLTFEAFGPDDATCGGQVAFTKPLTVNGNGEYGSTDFEPETAGTYRWVVTYSGDANNNGATSACNAPNEISTVAKASPTISTEATSATIGGKIHDTATIAGGQGPGGIVTFEAFGPDNAGCTGSPVFQKFVAVNGNGGYDSPDFEPATAGDYRWVVSYSGDGNNNGVTSACNAANETSTVAQASPTISTVATEASLGKPVHDSATIATGFNPGGTVTFQVFAPTNTTCNGSALESKTVAVSGNGNYDSPDFTAATIGDYRWIASYSGDANNKAATGACNDNEETSTVSKAITALSTEATDAAIGSAIDDTATLSGGQGATGTITFEVYGPDDATCAGPVAETLTANVSGNGTYGSGDFTPAQSGEYRWVASYSGDAENEGATGTCADPAELSTVANAMPTISTKATDTTIGGEIEDAATIAAGQNPTGTITFEAFAPGDERCEGTAAFSKTVPVIGNGEYASTSFKPEPAGTYRWIASYSGDRNNLAVAGKCGDAGESSTVAQAAPTLSSSATGATLGAAVHDTATLADGHLAGGTLTFTAYGPNDTACSGQAAFSATVKVDGSGSYGSGDFTPTAAGDYRWVVAYSGDADNRAVTAACGAAGETSSIAAPAAPPKPIVPCVPAPPPTAGGYVPKTTIKTGLVLGVRARIHVGTPSNLEIAATLKYRLNGKTHSVDLGTSTLENPGTRNLRIGLPTSLREVLPLGTKVRLALAVSTVPAGSDPCSAEAKRSHLAFKTKVVKVLVPR